MTDNNQFDLLTQIAAQLATLQQQSSLVNASGLESAPASCRHPDSRRCSTD